MRKLFTATAVLTLITSVIIAPYAAAVVTGPNANVGQALEIAPPVLDLKADPGQKIDAQINLRDISTGPLVVTSTVDDFTASGEEGIPKVLVDATEPTPYSMKTWIAPLNQLTLKAKQIQTLPVTINVPKNAAPGGYYSVIRFTATAPGMQDSGVSLSASLGALIFLRVNGEAKESVSIESFATVDDKGRTTSLFESKPVTFSVRVKDDGNVFEKPTGQIRVSDLFGNAVADVNVNTEQRVVLPGSVRKFDQDLDKTNVGDRFLFGLYHAKLTVHYGNNLTTTSDVSFWVIPWKLILGVLAALIVIIIGLRLIMKRYTDRVVGRSRSSRRR